MPDSEFSRCCTAYEDSDKLFESLKAGANGYLLKRTSSTRLLQAIHELYDGGSPMTPQIARRVVGYFSGSPGKPKSELDTLTPGQKKFYRGTGTGLQLQKEIADHLQITMDSVRSYIRRIYEKLHVHSRTEAVIKYLRALMTVRHCDSNEQNLFPGRLWRCPRFRHKTHSCRKSQFHIHGATPFPLQVYEVDAKDAPAPGRLRLEHFSILSNQAPWNDYDKYLSGVEGNQQRDRHGRPIRLFRRQKTDKVEWPENKVQSWVRGIAGNSNLAWWDLPEEARPWSARELKVLQDYTTWTRLNDPLRRPTYEYTPNNRNAGEISRIVPEVDVIGLSCYCEEMRMPHAWVRYKIQEAGLHGIALAGADVGRDYLHGPEEFPSQFFTAPNFPRPARCRRRSRRITIFWSAIVSTGGTGASARVRLPPCDER